VPSYRFCRTDDIELLVDALNRCWAPYVPDQPPTTAASFKRSIRDLQVWCSSCMVAFAGSDPIAVLIGAKRPSGTLIHKIAVHPDHVRQGHGRHLLASLSSKLAILGPPRIVAEIPETLAHASALFGASGYVAEAVLTDYVLQGVESDTRASPERAAHGDASRRGFLIPVTIDDLNANGLLGADPPPPVGSARQGYPQTCWQRSVETLTARKDEIAGIAVASDEQIEAYLLYMKRDKDAETEMMSLRSFIDDGGARLQQLLSRLGVGTVRFPKVHPAEISNQLLATLGFRTASRYLLYAATARSA
jgi:GNAT superfamily N-acetyltransferase